MVDALMSSMEHSASLHYDEAKKKRVFDFTKTLKNAIHATFRYGQGTRDMVGQEGLTTEQFIDKVTKPIRPFVVDKYLNTNVRIYSSLLKF